MKTRYLIVILIAGIIIAVMSAIGLFEAPRRGDVAPSFVLSGFAGGEASLEKERGKFVLLHFWATWCGTCLSEIPVIEKLYEEFKDRNVAVVTILVDDDGAMLGPLKDRMNFTYPVYADPKGLVADSYQVWGVPETFVIDRDGVILNRTNSALDYPSFRKTLEGYLSKK